MEEQGVDIIILSTFGLKKLKGINMNKRIYLVIISVIIVSGCASKNMHPTAVTELDKFQFIIIFSSDNVEFLKEAAVRYSEKAILIRRSDSNYYSNDLYNMCSQWSDLLNRKAAMIESGQLYEKKYE